MSKKKPRREKKPAPATKPKEPRPIPRYEQQFALIGDTLLDVEAAFRLLRAAPRRFVRIDVDSWARLYGLDGNPCSPIKVGAVFDPEHAKMADLRRPLILVTFITGNGQETFLIADGSHRLARAYSEGRDSLPAWILTAAETKAITVTAPPGRDCTKP